MGFNIDLKNEINYREKLRLPPLEGGGIILSYRCSNRCGHCLVAGSPERENRWLSRDEAGEIFDFIKKSAPYAEIHIGGGEPFLNPECLLDTVRAAVGRGIRLSYVETNGFWGNNPQKYEPVLKELHMAGLRSILISVSPFHAEFIKPRATMNAIKLVRDIFGYSGAFVWIPEFLDMLSEYDSDRTIDLETLDADLVKRAGDMYYLIPGGRCGYFNPPVADRRPAKDFFITGCGRELMSTGHFHIDAYGNYMPGGLCGGIRMCDYRESDDEINLNDKPLLKILFNEGVRGLYELAVRAGYSELPGGYCGKCHLCVDVRNFFFGAAGEKGDKFIELAPDEFYTTLAAENAKRKNRPVKL